MRADAAYDKPAKTEQRIRSGGQLPDVSRTRSVARMQSGAVAMHSRISSGLHPGRRASGLAKRPLRRIIGPFVIAQSTPMRQPNLSDVALFAAVVEAGGFRDPGLASLEAAKAGEHGKSFAVVAQEVKNLATQSARATDEIAGQIQAMQAVTQDAVQSAFDASFGACCP